MAGFPEDGVSLADGLAMLIVPARKASLNARAICALVVIIASQGAAKLLVTSPKDDRSRSVKLIC